MFRTKNHTHCAPVGGQSSSYLEPPYLSMEALRHLRLGTGSIARGAGAGRSPENQHWWEAVALVETASEQSRAEPG